MREKETAGEEERGGGPGGRIKERRDAAPGVAASCKGGRRRRRRKRLVLKRAVINFDERRCERWNTDAECVNHGTIMPDVNPAPVRLRTVHLSAARRGATSHKTRPHDRTVSKGLKLHKWGKRGGRNEPKFRHGLLHSVQFVAAQWRSGL